MLKSSLGLLDLFSGIGGFSLALRTVCRTVAFCDKDPRARRVILERMKTDDLDRAKIFDDVKSLRGIDLKKQLGRIDVVTAGFPCQDVSVMNRGDTGVFGERSRLVFEAIRISKEAGAAVIIFENSPNLKNRGLEVVLDALTKAGYVHQAWDVFSAAEVGAPHRRNRLYLVASLDIKNLRNTLVLSSMRQGTINTINKNWWSYNPAPSRVISKNIQRLKDLEDRGFLLGNSVVPWCAMHAINTLVSRLLTIDTFDVVKKKESSCLDRFDHGYSRENNPRERNRDINVVVPSEKTNTPKQVYRFKSWATPLATWWKISRVDSHRAARILPNQIVYEKRTKRYMDELDRRNNKPLSNIVPQHERYIVNPQFAEWMMGYPRDWTRVRMTE